MNRILVPAVATIFSLAGTVTADAQLVRVGPLGGVSVRAPFVRVDVLPFGGGTRVRAPFTRVNTGAYRFGYAPAPISAYPQPQHVQPDPVVTTPVEPLVDSTPALPEATSQPIAVDVGAATERLREAAETLLQSLRARSDDADVWIEYLQPDRIIATIDRSDSIESLRPLLVNYNGVLANRALASIGSTAGFVQTRRWLTAVLAAGEPSAATASEKFGDSVLESAEHEDEVGELPPPRPDAP